MENILEIKDILNHLNQRERKSVRKYFGIHYKNTKELQLLKIIGNLKEDNETSIENKILRMGYESTNCKSFLKLRSRLKEKLFDYLSSTFSINEIRQIDDHSYLNHRLKKMILQSGILIEKGLHIQANDLLRTALKLAQEYEQFDKTCEILIKLNLIIKTSGNQREQHWLTQKIKEYSELSRLYQEKESRFNLLLSQIEMQSLLHIEKSVIFFLINEGDNSSPYARMKLFKDYISIVKFCMEEDFLEATRRCLKMLKAFRTSSMKFDLEYKILYYKTFIDLLRICGKNKLAEHFAEHSILQSMPAHLIFDIKFNTRMSALRSGMVYEDKKVLRIQDKNSQGALKAAFYNAHLHFVQRNYRKCLDVINANIRSYSLSSYHQLDLMILDLMCHFEQGHFDLLDYKIQSYLKNLAYRSKFKIPMYYHKFHKVIRLMLRSEAGSYHDKIERFLEEIGSISGFGLLQSRSLQPKFFLLWARIKIARNEINALESLDKVA